MNTAIEWIVDFVEFFWLPLVILGLYLVGKWQDRKNGRKYGQRRSGHTAYTDNSGYHYGYHQPNNDPDFSYMNHDDPDDSGQKDYNNEAYGYGDQISPFNPDDQGAYEQMDDYNKNH